MTHEEQDTKEFEKWVEQGKQKGWFKRKRELDHKESACFWDNWNQL